MTRFLVKILHNFDLNPPYVDFDASRLEISRQVGSTIQNLIQFQFYLDIIIIFLLLWTLVLIVLSFMLLRRKNKV